MTFYMLRFTNDERWKGPEHAEDTICKAGMAGSIGLSLGGRF